MIKYFLLILLLVITPLAILLQVYFSGNWYSFFHSYSLGIVFGLLAWALFLFTLVLSSRVRLLEKIFGQDRLIVLHRYTGAGAVISGILHVSFKLYFSSDVSPHLISGAIAGSIIFPVSAMSLLILSRSVFDRFRAVKMVKSYARRSIRYSTMKFLHNGIALALAIILIHILIAPSTAETSLRSVIIMLTGIPVLGLWIYHKLIRPYFYIKGRIKEIHHFTDRLFSVKMEFLKSVLSIMPGQFCYFRFPVPGVPGEEHPLTISGVFDHQTAEVLIKREGLWTNSVSGLEPGLPVSISRPYGKFDLSSQCPMLWVAGGVGITPFLSRIRSLRNEKLKLNVRTVLIWSARTGREMPYRDEIEDYENMDGNFTFIPMLTREKTASPRIDSDFIKRKINELSHKNASLWYCGPLLLRRHVFRGAKEAGIKAGNMHWEEFSLA